MGERGSGYGFGGEIGVEDFRADVERGEADSTYGDTVPGFEFRGEGRGGDGDLARSGAIFDGDDGSGGFDEAREHESRLTL